MEYSFFIPDAVVLGNLSEYVSIQQYGEAQKCIGQSLRHGSRVIITPEQWRELCDIEARCQANLPKPFSCEALGRDFRLEIAGTDYVVVFQQSCFANIKLSDGRRLRPKVDVLIGWRDCIKYLGGKKPKGEKDGPKQHLGGIGLLYDGKSRTAKVAYYWFGVTKKGSSVGDSIVGILSDYFTVQYAFHVLPDRIVEAGCQSEPADGNLQSAESTAPQPREVSRRHDPNVIQHTIYVDDRPVLRHDCNRKYHCDCWFVRGHWRVDKDGKQVWIEPYFKGRDRFDPTARRRALATDSYVPYQ